MRAEMPKFKTPRIFVYPLITGLMVIALGCNQNVGTSGVSSRSSKKLDVYSVAKSVNRTNISELKGVDLSGLNPAQKEIAIRLMNKIACNCGCYTATVAQCLVRIQDCEEVNQQARLIVDRLKNGVPESQIVKETYETILRNRIRGNAQPLLESIGHGKAKDDMVAQIAAYTAGIDMRALKLSGDELKDARATAALFLGKDMNGILKYIEGNPDELYLLHGITYELLGPPQNELFEYYFFSHRPELRDKLFPYLNPAAPEEDMIIAMVANLMTPPSPPGGYNVDPGTSPSKGAEGAKVVVVEFSDYQCPYSRKVQKTMDQIVKAYPNQVRHVYKNFPLSFHRQAKLAAQAALAAEKQGKFWEMHEKIFKNPRDLSREKFEEFARELGLDLIQFKEDIDSPAVVKQVMNDLREATILGVTSTPTVFVNGVMMKGAQPFCPFMEIIEKELAK